MQIRIGRLSANTDFLGFVPLGFSHHSRRWTIALHVRVILLTFSVGRHIAVRKYRMLSNTCLILSRTLALYESPRTTQIERSKRVGTRHTAVHSGCRWERYIPDSN